MEPKCAKGPLVGMRHVQAFLLFSNMVAIYINRLNIGVAVVAMTNADTTNPNFVEFAWNEKEISYILSSFSWGYIATQFVGGLLTKHFGAKLIMGCGTFTSGVLSILTPFGVRWGGWPAFCGIRCLQGLSQGLLFPCIFEHLAKWSPKQERNRLGAFSLTGMDFGTILAMAISGIIAAGPLGWPGIFYISGALCLGWCVMWLLLAANNPCQSRYITREEKVYIESSMAHQDDFHQKKIPTPWKAIAMSVPFLVLIIMRCSQKWGRATLEAQIPSYLNGVLNMDLKSNGLFSALPFLASWLMSYVYMVLADIIQHKGWMTLTTMRRVFSTIASWLPALGLIVIGFLDEQHRNWAVALMTVSVAVNSGQTIGSSLNVIDLSPNHSGVLLAIVNTGASLMPLISPLAVGEIVTDVHNRSMWQIIFAISAVIFFVGNLLYIIFGTATTQSWDAEDYLLPRPMESSDMAFGNSAYSSPSIKHLN